MVDFPLKTAYSHKTTSQKKHLLPKGVIELIDVVGYEAASILVEHFKGVAIWVPKIAKPEHPLSLLIGFDAFQKLSRYYGDTSVEINRCEALNRENRNKKIVEDSRSLTQRDLARKYMTTERHIRRILSKSFHS